MEERKQRTELSGDGASPSDSDYTPPTGPTTTRSSSTRGRANATGVGTTKSPWPLAAWRRPVVFADVLGAGSK
jgi:hypothetical protein